MKEKNKKCPVPAFERREIPLGKGGGFFSFLVLGILFSLVSSVFSAEEITLLYTGDTHSMIYHCNCPREPDGGITRRAALIRELRKSHSDLLVLDSGGFFGGGLMDEYTQNVELDKRRTLINLKAMEIMGYDAAAVGDDEFNFGREFFERSIKEKKIAFLSCNIKSDKLLPYTVKKIGGINFGIIGVTNYFAKEKAGGLEFMEPETAVKQAIEELKKEKVNIIILLSHLGETETLNLVGKTEGIDIVILGHSRTKGENATKINSTLIIRPFWQGRRLGKVSLKIEENKIIDYDLEELRVSGEIKDDPAVSVITPACFSDNNCINEGNTGTCRKPGTMDASCVYKRVSKVNFYIVVPKNCLVCDSEDLIGYFKRLFPGLSPSFIYYPGGQANKLIKKLNAKTLPVYFFDKEIEKENNFEKIKNTLDLKDNLYVLQAPFSGVSHFLERERIKGKFDLFLSLYDKNTPELLETIKDFNPRIHFLVSEENGGFDSLNGQLETEEYLRAVCVQKYYPEYFWDYINCRSKKNNSSWWEDCLGSYDAVRIRNCAKCEEGKSLLRENISLNEELQIKLGPAYLIDNYEIFSSQEGIPSKETFEKVLRK